MLAINATVHVATEPPASVEHHNETNGCFNLMLSGSIYGPYVSLYGTYEQLEKFLREARQALVSAHAFGLDDTVTPSA